MLVEGNWGLDGNSNGNIVGDEVGQLWNAQENPSDDVFYRARIGAPSLGCSLQFELNGAAMFDARSVQNILSRIPDMHGIQVK